jgi:hypothetical protein
MEQKKIFLSSVGPIKEIRIVLSTPETYTLSVYKLKGT